MAEKRAKFVCHYVLDERPDLELVNLNQESYRFVQKALEPKYFFTKTATGTPDPVELWLVYFAVLIQGAADAALVLTLHNLGREARLLQRQIFEYIGRATYYANNPVEARLELNAEPVREKALLDRLGYDKTSARYQNVLKMVDEVGSKYPESLNYTERNFRDMLGPQLNEDITNFYALHYRLHSQVTHGTVLGVRDIFEDVDEAGQRVVGNNITFDSREKNPNLSIEAVTAYVLYYLDLMAKHLNVNILTEVDDLKKRFSVVQARIWGPILGEKRAHENFLTILQKVKESKLIIDQQSELTAVIRGKEELGRRLVWRLLNAKTADGDYRLILEATVQYQLARPGMPSSQPRSTDVSGLPVDTVVEMITTTVADRMRQALRILREQGRSDGYVWFDEDGKSYMWATTAPIEVRGYVINLSSSATDDDLVARAIATADAARRE